MSYTKGFENILGKCENAGYQHFLYQLFGKRINRYSYSLGITVIALVQFSLKINPFPNNKNLDWSKLKAIADDKLNAIEKLKFVLGWVENIVGKDQKIRGILFYGCLSVRPPIRPSVCLSAQT